MTWITPGVADTTYPSVVRVMDWATSPSFMPFAAGGKMLFSTLAGFGGRRGARHLSHMGSCPSQVMKTPRPGACLSLLTGGRKSARPRRGAQGSRACFADSASSVPDDPFLGHVRHPCVRGVGSAKERSDSLQTPFSAGFSGGQATVGLLTRYRSGRLPVPGTVAKSAGTRGVTH